MLSLWLHQELWSLGALGTSWTLAVVAPEHRSCAKLRPGLAVEQDMIRWSPVLVFVAYP